MKKKKERNYYNWDTKNPDLSKSQLKKANIYLFLILLKSRIRKKHQENMIGQTNIKGKDNQFAGTA